MAAEPEPPAGSAPAHEYVLPLEGFQGTPDEIERQWYERCYLGRGDRMLQLTWRAVIMGSLLGGILSLTNLYIGLKSGWGFGVAITACILSYAIWTALRAVTGGWLTPMTILENNCMQSCASSAGYSTGGTLVSAIAAYIVINGASIPTLPLMAWVFFLAVLGVTMAIPMKRQLINIEQLRFPSGIAAAGTLRALHTGGQEGLRSATALGIAWGLAALNKFWTDGLSLISDRLVVLQLGTWVNKFNHVVLGERWIHRGLEFTWEPMFIAAGAITGLRACASMFLGAVTCWLIFVPWIDGQGLESGDGFRAFNQWSLWAGAACMVTSGIFSFALQWKSALRAFADLGKMFVPRRGGAEDPVAAIETPASWFFIGQIVGTAGLAWLAWHYFQMPVWLTVIAVLMSFGLALVACRVCGETDTTPVGAMGKITQLTFGAIAPRNINTNLMAACITAGAADSSSDLLTDLKSGYLLGAHPRRQFLAQFSGIFIGTLVSVWSFNILAKPDTLGSKSFPATAAMTWSAVARALSEGLEHLPEIKVWCIILGGLVGIVLPLLSAILPAQAAKWVPSAAALGLAWTFNFHYSLFFLTGAVIGHFWEKRAPQNAGQLMLPVAAGLTAGESLTGVGIEFARYASG